MRTIFYGFCFILLLSATPARAQVFEVDTLQYQGNTRTYINFVILGDGYTQKEQAKFQKDATVFKEYFFNQIPYTYYKNYFNVFIIRVISAESGVKHPHTANDCPASMPTQNPNNYFGTTFDKSGIHRLVVVSNTVAVARVLANNFPTYDQVIVLANSNYYGGSGGAFATATVNVASNEIAVHEMGHSFANLADEYWAGAGYAAENANRTQENNPAQVKWKNWLGTNNIGIYSYGGKAPLSIWYRPAEYCKMQYLGYPFCSVCTEAIIEKIHSLTSPIKDYYQSNSFVATADSPKKFSVRLNKPVPNTLKTDWYLNNVLIAKNTDSVWINPASLTNDSNTVEMITRDTTTLVRNNDFLRQHTYSIAWTLPKNTVAFPAPKVRWNDVEACEGKSTVLTIASPQSGITYNWYTGSEGGMLVGTGVNFITPAIIQNTTFYAEASTETKKSARTAVTVKKLPVPAAPDAVLLDDTLVCPGHSARLRVLHTDAALNYRWYYSETGVQYALEDSMMMTHPLSTTIAYYVASVNKITGCSSNTRIKIVVPVLAGSASPCVQLR